MDVIKVKLKAEGGVTPPSYATAGASGMDLRASEAAVIKAGKRGIVGTGLCIELPEGYEAQVRPRSGLAFKHGVTVLNAPGTIDSDYRGEIRVILINLGEEDFAIEPGNLKRQTNSAKPQEPKAASAAPERNSRSLNKPAK